MGQKRKIFSWVTILKGGISFLLLYAAILPWSSFAAPNAEGEPPVPKTPPPLQTTPTQTIPLPQTPSEKIAVEGGYEALVQKISKDGTVRIIAGLNLPYTPLGDLNQVQAEEQLNAIANAQEALKQSLANYNVTNLVLFQYIPYAAMDVDAAALEALLNMPLVSHIEENIKYELTLDLSVPRIGAPTVWARGYTGSGITVAVLDSGVEKTHPFLISKVVSEACYSSGQFSVCPGGGKFSTALNSALPYASGVCKAPICDHGTHVAGIISGGTGIGLSGVAPNANLIAIQLTSSTTFGYSIETSDIILGLNRVFTLGSTHTIAAVNMSLGGGFYTDQTTCDATNAAIKAAIDNLRSVNIATIASSGNDFWLNATRSPACISSAISVGATDDADAVASYSNSASFLNLLAPGSDINSSIPPTAYASWNGTSMAAPHVAGAFALLRQAKPSATVSEILTALTNSGVPIKDTRNNLVKPRIDLNAAISLLLGKSCPNEPTNRLSVSSTGTQTNAESWFPSISDDGRYVSFHSDATTLVTSDTNARRDIFVRDQQSSLTSCVSVSSLGVQADGSSEYASISGNGGFVVFQSAATNLIPGDNNGAIDVFVHDRSTATTSRVSVASGGGQANGASNFPVISADGRYVAFYSYASNLVTGDTKGKMDIFVHDRSILLTTRVSVSSAGFEEADGDSKISAISADGRYVAFDSFAKNLVPNDTNAASDIFVHDRSTNQTTRVSIASGGSEAHGHSFEPDISADGRYVTFKSAAEDLVSNDTNKMWDIFVHDRHTGQTTRVSVTDVGIQANGDSNGYPSISPDGRFVAFGSNASNLVAMDNNGFSDIFMYDRYLTQTRRVSIPDGGGEGNNFAYIFPDVSENGSYVAFESLASNLVPADTNGVMDVFLHKNGLIPCKPILIAPILNVVTSDWNPSFTWNAVTGATQYEWYLQPLTTQDGAIQQTFSPAQANCAFGVKCSIPSPITLGKGPYLWRVRADNLSGPGEWSDDGRYNTPANPQAISLKSPLSGVQSKQPVFVWFHIPEVTKYRLWVNGAAGAVIRQEIEPTQYQCTSTINECTVASPQPLKKGSYTWWVQAYNPSGESYWSSGATFSVE